jgi:hypothetical protein
MADPSDTESDSDSGHSSILVCKTTGAKHLSGSDNMSGEETSGDDLVSEISKASVRRDHPIANTVSESYTGAVSVAIAAQFKPLVSDAAFENTTYHVKDPSKSICWKIPRSMFVHAPSPSINGTELTRICVSMKSFTETNAGMRQAFAKALVREHGADHIAERLMFVKLLTKDHGLSAFLPMHIEEHSVDPCVEALQGDGGVALFSFPCKEALQLIRNVETLPREFSMEAGKWVVTNPPYTREAPAAWSKIYPVGKRRKRSRPVEPPPETTKKSEEEDLRPQSVGLPDGMQRTPDSRVTRFTSLPRREEWRTESFRIPAGVAIKIKIEMTPQTFDACI